MKPKIYLTTTFILLQVFCLAQKNFETLVLKIDSSLQNSSEAFPRETILMHSDKQEYFTGENISVSVFLNINNHASVLSRTAYIELGDYNGKVIAKRMLEVSGGIAHGLISIPVETLSGVYVINAYSIWMKNTPEVIAQKHIAIIGNDFKKSPFLLHNYAGKTMQVDFVGESKGWANGAEQKFILRLTGENNLPVLKPFVIAENGKEIFRGTTDSNGLASIIFTPNSAAAYVLRSDGKDFKLVLNHFSDAAISLNNTKTKLFVSLQKSASAKSNRYLLVAIDEEKVCYQAVFDEKQGAMATAIAKAKLPAGLINFLLFDEDEKLAGQRYFFNYRESPPLPLKIINGGVGYVDGDTSLMHRGATYFSLQKGAGILGPQNNLLPLLSPLLNGYAAQVPDFSTASLQTADQLFCLAPSYTLGMQWTVSHPSLKFPVESGIPLRGNIKPFAGNANPAGYTASLVIRCADSSKIYSTVKTDSKGDFALGDLSFQKEARIFFQGHNDANKKELLNMQLYPSHFDTLKTLTVMPRVKYQKHPSASAVTDSAIKKFSEYAIVNQYKMLETVVVKTKYISPMDSLKKEYLTPLFDDGAATVLQPEGHFITLWHFLRGKVPGLRIEGSLENPNIYFTRYGGTLTPNNSDEIPPQLDADNGVLFFLNEVQVSKEVLNTLNTDDIAIVSINKGPIPVLGASNGMIAIFTKRGVSAGTSTSKGMAFEKKQGYSNYQAMPYGTVGSKQQHYYFGSFFEKAIPYYNLVLAGWNKTGEFIMHHQ